MPAMARKTKPNVDRIVHNLETAREKLHAADDTTTAMADTLNKLRTVVDAALRPHFRTPEIAAALIEAEHMLAAYYSGAPTKDPKP